MIYENLPGKSRSVVLSLSLRFSEVITYLSCKYYHFKNQPHDEEYIRFDLINHAASQKERNACGKRSLLLPQSLGYGRAGDGDREKDAKPLQEWLETRRLKLALCRTEVSWDAA
ncbi:hypothetical protein TNIN_78331 [Trichonephila inaurata madagascariensis]|uniref:Uncharacterized protein n=1 Tax=Trichonephila inaurata madagascariensis TaxID=2747483 RepID=A0A8X6YCG1_9ARAC|nr:hypothetical protein TNIN_78331 [Trichonephila inaurata madagascariensis]